MDREREEAIRETLETYGSEGVKLLVHELLLLRRERHRTKLESEEASETRGRAKECKDLLQLFS